MIDYKCPACGGALQFDPKLQKMKCPFCDSVFEMEELQTKDDILGKKEEFEAEDTIEDGEAAEESLQTEESYVGWKHPQNQWDKGETDNMVVLGCKSCGGEIVGDSNTGATSCPYCGNPVVITGSFTGALKPDYVIPFKLDKKDAKARYHKHIEGKYLLPKLFKDKNHIDEIKGIYVPFWLYDADVSANMTYKAESVRAWSDNHYDYEEVSFFDIHRGGTMTFNNIPCDGSSQMDDTLMESIEPFDFDEAVPFESAYLAGYYADKYDVDSRDNEKRIQERIEKSAADTLRDTITGTYSIVHEPTNKSVSIMNGKVKYALYPVWMLTTTYQGERYTFAMNGQTGKFVGNLPINKGKLSGTYAGIVAGVAAVWSALMYLIFG